ncbi:transcription repressor OFP13-like [Curcuma longa]|uniref:transcription repressor OFP13-like n=1 Tax=Curcuma longa TaxID=136217 RepID=UPI003D9EA249
MGKKLGLGALFFGFRDSPRLSARLSPPSPSSSSWAWHSCKRPKTASFRDGGAGAGVFKTVNSVYLDSDDSCCTTDHERSFSAAESSETMVRRLRSDRLFFDPGGDTSSIMGEAKAEVEAAAEEEAPFDDSVALALDSEDPYRDFRRSMEEMVAAHGLGGDWERLEELLVWYLRVNVKKTHGFIVGAFVDLLAAINASSSSTSCSYSSSSASNSFKIEEITEEDTNEPCSSSSLTL